MTTRLLTTLSMLSAYMLAVTDGYADACVPEDTHGAYELERRTTTLTELLPVADLLTALEAYDQCDTLARIDRGLDLQYANNARVHAAIVMVTTIGRNPARASARDVQVAYDLARRLPFRSHRQALVDYAARKLASVPENEPLFAFALGTIPQTELTRIARTATRRIPKGPWAPPGDQPIPFYIGNQAHRRIAEYYREAHKGEQIRLNHSPISSLLITFADNGVGPPRNRHLKTTGDHALRPDITNLTTRELYEIKPAGADAAAAAIALAYIKVFADAGVPLKPARSHAPGTRGVVPAPGGYYRFYSPRPGVIVYQYRRGDYLPIAVEQPEGSENEQPLPASPEQRLAVRIPAMPRSRHSTKPGFMERISQATGLSGKWLLVYVIFSEGSRLFLPRNAS